MRALTKISSLLVVVACLLFSASNAGAAPPSQGGDGLRAMVQTLIENDVGTLVELKDNGSAAPPIIIIQEFHKSTLGNIETAVILYRLYRDYGSRAMGIEGAFGPLDVGWYHNFGTVDDSIAVQHLIEGEISNAELLALVRPDITVFGLENEEQYLDNLAQSAAISSSVPILVVFATSQMTPEQLAEADAIRADQGIQAYIDFCLTFDSQAQEQYEALYLNGMTSAEEAVQIVEAISNRAFASGLDQIPELVPFLQNMQRELEYFRGVDQRTYTMAENAIALAQQHSDAPFAIVTGLAHAARMKDLIQEAGYSYILLQAHSLQATLTEPHPIGMMSAEAYDRKAMLQSVDEPGLLGALLDNRNSQIRLQPAVHQVFYKRKAASYITFDRLGQYLRDHPDLSVTAGGDFPSADLLGLLTELAQMGVQIDPNTMRVVRADPNSADSTTNRALLIHVTMPETVQNGVGYPAVQYWAKVTFSDVPIDRVPALEELLLAARETILNETPSQPGVINVSIDTLAAVADDQQTVLAQTIKAGT